LRGPLSPSTVSSLAAQHGHDVVRVLDREYEAVESPTLDRPGGFKPMISIKGEGQPPRYPNSMKASKALIVRGGWKPSVRMTWRPWVPISFATSPSPAGFRTVASTRREPAPLSQRRSAERVRPGTPRGVRL
jgi:hypothetical protein